MKVFVKDPDSTLDYAFNWSAWLSATDKIIASSFSVDAGITNEPGGESFSDTTTRLYLSGGTAGENYRVINTITTEEGRIDERTIEIRVRQR